MENKLYQAKEIYKNQEIPEELSIMMNKMIKESEHQKQRKEPQHKRRWIASGLAVAGICCMVFTVGLNTSQSFAKSMEDIPLIGSIAKVLTFKDYAFTSDVIKAEITIPAIEGLSDKKVEKAINEEIYNKMEGLLYEAETRALEYKKARLETGGKEEDFNLISVQLDYEVKSITEDCISFVIFKTEDSFAAYSLETIFFNINPKTSKDITLKDIIGDDYINRVNKQVKKHIDANPGDFFEGEMGFTSISEEQKFYINEKGNPVVVFDKYEIASGSMGQQEIEIPL